MLHYSVKPIRLVLSRSVLLAAVIMTASVSACAIVLCMPVHLGLKIGACLIVISASAFKIAQHAWLVLPQSCLALDLDDKGRLQLMRKDGARLEAKVLPDSFVSAYLTVLNVTTDGSKWRGSVILMPDGVDAEAYRRLRVWLRWGRHAWRDQGLPEDVR